MPRGGKDEAPGPDPVRFIADLTNVLAFEPVEQLVFMGVPM